MPADADVQHIATARYVKVGSEDAGQRLDNYLIRTLKGIPKTRVYRALRKGEIRVNKGRARADYRIAEGDLVRIPPLRHASDLPAPRVATSNLLAISRQILYEDDSFLAINKPSGLAVHGGSGLNFGLIECLRQLRPDARYLELVHRLDRDTSGVILVAKRAAVLRELHRLLREKHIDKRYRALVRGKWPKSVSVIDAPLEKNVTISGERMVRVGQSGRRAITEFRIIEQLDGATLIEAKPITGRTHQIRVHARLAGFPLLGDTKYSNDQSEAFTRQIGLKRLFLHALSLEFHLESGGHFRLEAPLDLDLENILISIRK